jgi:hypothetical protein
MVLSEKDEPPVSDANPLLLRDVLLWFVEGYLNVGPAVLDDGAEKSIIIPLLPLSLSSSPPTRGPAEKGETEWFATGEAEEMELVGCEFASVGDVVDSFPTALGMFVSEALLIKRPPMPCFCLNFSSHEGLLIFVSASLNGRAYIRACSCISASDTRRPLCCSLRSQLASVLSMSGILPLLFLIGELLRSSGLSHLSLRLRTLDTVLEENN